MNEKDDKTSEAEKSSANFFAELLTSDGTKITQRLKIDFTFYLTIVNFKILHLLLKKLYKDTAPLEVLPEEIVEAWRQNEIEMYRTAAKAYEEHCKTDVGKVLKSVMRDPKDLLKEQMTVISRAATAFQELLTKKSKLFTFRGE
jgi:hypothetical protein